MKYYIITYVCRKIAVPLQYESELISKHPVERIVELNEEREGAHYELVFYAEISQKLFEAYKDKKF